MAQKFRKVVVTPGTHHHRKGVAEISPARIAGWVEKFRRMKADGIKIPIPWGHQPKADPVEEDRLAEEEFYRSRYNATYADDFELGPQGELIVVGTAPPGYDVDPETGDLVNPADHTRIGEVSIAVRDWQDGKGRLWTDAIRHVALTPLPVNHGTPGFEVALATDDWLPGELRLGAATLYSPSELDLGTTTTKGTAMPDPTKKTPPAADEPVDLMAEDDAPEPEPEEPKEDDKPLIDFTPPEEPGGNAEELVAELIPLLEEAKIHLTPDTNAKNFLQHLKVAMHAVKHREAPEPAPTPMPAAPAGAPAQAPVVEETPPLLMSTAAATNPREKAAIAFATKAHRGKTESRIDGLAKVSDKHGVPWLTPARVEALRTQASGFELSLTADGEPVETELDRTLGLLEELQPFQLGLYDADEQILPEHQEAVAEEEIVNKLTTPGPQKKTA